MRTLSLKFIFAIVTICSQGHALTLKLQNKDLALTESARAQAVLAETLQLLPTKMREVLAFNLEIEFVKFETTTKRARLGMAGFGQNKILLNREFLAPLATGIFNDRKFHQTLAHEIAHFYDQAVGLSSMAEFRALTGWRRTTTGVVQINNFQRRWPDVYMNQQPSETFPTLFEFFIFDPEFQCRSPEIARYFSAHFNLRQNAKCDDRMLWYTSVNNEDGGFREINRQRIWAVDFMWASEGKGIASRDGHAMLRLVVCGSDRTPGPDCYKDVSSHLTLSYAAASASGSFANLAGLTGKYPLNLYASSFMTTLRQYNMTELRDLYAVPLKMSEHQKQLLIDVLYARHWNLDGDYYFTLQNCATEIDRMVRKGGLEPPCPIYKNTHFPHPIPPNEINKLFQQYAP
jgi:hypothetical protein